MVSSKIKRIRELFGKTQEEIAEKLNITPQAYSRMERGESSISVERMEDIAKALGVSVEDIYKFDEKKMVISGNTNHGEAHDNALHFNLTIHEHDCSKAIEILEKTIEKQQEEIVFLRHQLECLTKRKE